MVNFGSRYMVLTNLIRNLHDEVLGKNISPQDAERFLLQINRLRDRLRLMGNSVLCSHGLCAGIGGDDCPILMNKVFPVCCLSVQFHC